MKDFLLYYRGFPPVERNPLLNGGLHRQVCEAATHRDAPEEGFESSSPPKSSFPHESGIELCGRQASYPLDHSGCEEWCRKGGFPHPHRSSGRGVCPAQFWLFVRRRGCFSIGRSRVLVNCRQTHGLLASATQRNKQQIHQNSKQEITTLIIIIISNSNDKKTIVGVGDPRDRAARESAAWCERRSRARWFGTEPFPARALPEGSIAHVRISSSFQQPTFQKMTNNQGCSYSHFKCCYSFRVTFWNVGCWCDS